MFLASYLMWIRKLSTRFEYQILVKLFSLSARTQASTWNSNTTGMLPKYQLMLRWQPTHNIFGGDVTPPPLYVTFCH